METLLTAGNRTIEPIVLDHLVLDGEAVRDADGNYLMKSQQGWEQHFAGSGKLLPTVREYIIAIKQLDERHDPALHGILQDLRESSLCTGTKIDYRNSNLPQGSGYLDVLVKDPAWRTALQDEVLHYDTTEAVDVLKKASGKRLYIWTPDARGRKSSPERAVWLDVSTDRSDLDCNDDPINSIGRSRGVVRRGASASEQEAPAGRDACEDKNSVMEQNATRLLTRDEILTIAKPLVAVSLWHEFTKIVPEKAPVSGDVLQLAADGQYFSPHSWEEFKTKLGK